MVGDLGVQAAVGDQVEHLGLAWGQAQGVLPGRLARTQREARDVVVGEPEHPQVLGRNGAGPCKVLDLAGPTGAAVSPRTTVGLRGGRMLERDTQLAKLHTLLADVEHVGGKVVLVRGEAGVGKTVLVDRFLHEIGDRADVHVGLCDDLLTPQPLGPVWDVARGRGAVADALVAGDRGMVTSALHDMLNMPGQTSVLVVEDTQWADDATLDVLTFLGRRIRQMSALLILTYRDGEIDVHHPLRRVIGDLPPAVVERVRLRPLSPDAVAELVDGDMRKADRLVALTGGNPLFVTEVLAAGHVARGGRVPGSVRDAVLARVAKLAPAARDLVKALSAVPGRVEWTLVADLAHGGDDLVHAAARQGLFDAREDGVAFRHELQRRAVEASLPVDELRQRHAAVLDALGDDVDPARLAHHARGADDTSALLVHAPRAGWAALAMRSHREALGHFASIGPHLDQLPVDEAADVAEAWARAATHSESAGAWETVVEAVALRRAAGDPRALARCLASGVFVLAVAGEDEQARAWADEAVRLAAAVNAPDVLARALTEQTRVHLLLGDHEAAADVVDRAIRLAEGADDQRSLASAMILSGVLARQRGDVEGVATIEQARRLARRAGHHYEEADALLMLGMDAAVTDDLGRASSHLDRALTVAVEHEYDDLALFVRGLQAEVALRAGDWTEAGDLASEILAALAPPDAEALARRVLAALAVRRGRRDADEEVGRMWKSAQRVGAPYLLGAAGAVASEHAWLIGALGEDEGGLLEAAWSTRERIPRSWSGDEFSYWMWRLGLLEGVPSFATDGYRLLGAGDTASAAASWAARGMPYREALALTHGDDEEVVRAVQLLEALGADGTARRVRADLRERGVTVPRGRSRSARDHPAGLTERQAEVLGLLVDGLSNSAIADHLFISHRTVENHVASVLRKLDVADRDAAVAEARERGLLA